MRQLRFLQLCAFLLLVGAVDPARAGDHVPAAEARAAMEGFDELAIGAIEDFNVPGLAIAVVAAGEIVYARGVGQRDLENDLPMTPNTLFAIGSTTKAMTATVLGMIVDDGELDWDKPLLTYLPNFRLADPMITERITPRDLVTHRSGLPRHDMVWYNNNESTRGEIIMRLAHLELSEDLRAKFQYNNLMFMTAGYLAGQLSGTTWEEVMRQRLFAPLGMERTNFSVDESQKDPDHALPYRETDEGELERIPFRKIDLIGPAGSVNSSVNEMCRWLMLNLDAGKVGDVALVNSSTLADIHSPQMATGRTVKRADISPSTYGMGWGIDTYRGHRRILHGGGIDGFITSVMLFPDDGIGIVSFNNRGSGLPSLLNQHAADRLLGLAHEDWIGEALEKRIKNKEADEEAAKKKDATRVEGTSPSHALTDYAGRYEHAGYGTLLVELAGETLQVVYNGITAPLEHWHYDVWNGAETEGDKTFEDQKFIFRGNLDGKVAALESTFEPRADPIVFHRRPDSSLRDPGFLAGLVGAYETADGTKIQIELAGNALVAAIAGQPALTLEPDISGRFVIQEARQVSVGFELDEAGIATKMLLYQPAGVFEAPRIREATAEAASR